MEEYFRRRDAEEALPICLPVYWAAPAHLAFLVCILEGAAGLDGLARRNDLAGAFVVEATAAQIRELAATPGVQAIRLNRRHRNIPKADTLGPEGLERKKA